MRFNLIAAALMLALLFYLFYSATEDEPGTLSVNELLLADYDYFMVDVDSTHFKLDGKAEYRLRAERFTHYPDPGYTDVNAPRLEIYQDTGNPWFISADNGRIETDLALEQEKVELDGNVVIHRIDNRGEALNVYTESLTIYPDLKNVTTSYPVRITAGTGEITSTGMTADLNSNRVQLLENVRGRYE
ncbi:MAG: LPS export ABC transporter periplasmic protein LptC [Pseudomonadales bacterium]|nr:LPS export ABC transporter periplasmic protein LptC [Pseudomonadales bacterium]